MTVHNFLVKPDNIHIFILWYLFQFPVFMLITQSIMGKCKPSEFIKVMMTFFFWSLKHNFIVTDWAESRELADSLFKMRKLGRHALDKYLKRTTNISQSIAYTVPYQVSNHSHEVYRKSFNRQTHWLLTSLKKKCLQGVLWTQKYVFFTE